MKSTTDRAAFIVVLALSVLHPGCIPTIANLSKGETVPMSIADYAPAESEVLVFPLWWEMSAGPSVIWSLRDPYIIPVAAIGTEAANVHRRMSFYLDSVVCGGPSKWVYGYLVVTKTGTFLFTTGSKYDPVRSAVNVSRDTQALKHELTALMSGGHPGPRLRMLMHIESADDVVVRLHANEEARLAVAQFLTGIPLAP